MDEIVKYLSANYVNVISVIISLLALIGAIIKSIKNKNTNGLISIMERIPALVTSAEKKFGSGHGEDKLEDVLMKLRMFVLENKLNVSTQVLTDNINNVVESTKHVNVDKTKTLPNEDVNGVTNNSTISNKINQSIN